MELVEIHAMRRLVVLLIVAAFLIALPATHVVAEKDKVDVCHVNSANDAWLYSFGQVISVSESALKAHRAHGDSTRYETLTDSMREYFEKELNLKLPNAYCYFKKIITPKPK